MKAHYIYSFIQQIFIDNLYVLDTMLYSGFKEIDITFKDLII